MSRNAFRQSASTVNTRVYKSFMSPLPECTHDTSGYMAFSRSKSFASPKSETFAFHCASTSMLLDLISRWTTFGSKASCKYANLIRGCQILTAPRWVIKKAGIQNVNNYRAHYGIKSSPFSGTHNYPHACFPWKYVGLRQRTMQPLLQIAVINILIHKHPEQSSIEWIRSASHNGMTAVQDRQGSAERVLSFPFTCEHPQHNIPTVGPGFCAEHVRSLPLLL